MRASVNSAVEVISCAGHRQRRLQRGRGQIGQGAHRLVDGKLAGEIPGRDGEQLTTVGPVQPRPCVGDGRRGSAAAADRVGGVGPDRGVQPGSGRVRPVIPSPGQHAPAVRLPGQVVGECPRCAQHGDEPVAHQAVLAQVPAQLLSLSSFRPGLPPASAVPRPGRRPGRGRRR
jgi:hypothetical protein